MYNKLLSTRIEGQYQYTETSAAKRLKYFVRAAALSLGLALQIPGIITNAEAAKKPPIELVQKKEDSSAIKVILDFLNNIFIKSGPIVMIILGESGIVASQYLVAKKYLKQLKNPDSDIFLANLKRILNNPEEKADKKVATLFAELNTQNSTLSLMTKLIILNSDKSPQELLPNVRDRLDVFMAEVQNKVINKMDHTNNGIPYWGLIGTQAGFLIIFSNIGKFVGNGLSSNELLKMVSIGGAYALVTSIGSNGIQALFIPYKAALEESNEDIGRQNDRVLLELALRFNEYFPKDVVDYMQQLKH